MPQSTWYEQYKQRSAPTPNPPPKSPTAPPSSGGSSWYDRYKQSTPPSAPRRVNTPPTINQPTTTQKIIAGGLRTVPAIAGGFLGGTAAGIPTLGLGSIGGAAAGGAAGSALGESLAEWYELQQGIRKEFNPYQVGTQAALGAIPILGKAPGAAATARQLGKYALSGAGQGAILGAGSTAATQFAEDRTLPTLGQVGQGAAFGGAFGGATAGALGSLPRVMNKGIDPNLLPQQPKVPIIPDVDTSVVPSAAPAIAPPSRQLTAVAGMPPNFRYSTAPPVVPKTPQRLLPGRVGALPNIDIPEPAVKALPPVEPVTPNLVTHPTGRTAVRPYHPDVPETLRALDLGSYPVSRQPELPAIEPVVSHVREEVPQLPEVKPIEGINEDIKARLEQPEAPKRVHAHDRWQAIVDELDAKKAPDSKYRDILSTGSKDKLKKGETWRGRVLNYIKMSKITADKLEAEDAAKLSPVVETPKTPIEPVKAVTPEVLPAEPKPKSTPPPTAISDETKIAKIKEALDKIKKIGKQSSGAKKLRAGVEPAPKKGAKLAETAETPVIPESERVKNWAGTPKIVSSGTGDVKGGTPNPVRFPRELDLEPLPDLPTAPPKLTATDVELTPKPAFKSGEGVVGPERIDVVPTAGKKRGKRLAFVASEAKEEKPQSIVNRGYTDADVDPNRFDVTGIKPSGKSTKEVLQAAEKKGGKGKRPRKTVEEIIAKKTEENPILKEPTFRNAISAIPARLRKTSLYKAIYEPLGVSSLTKLSRMGKSGESLAKLLKDEKTASNVLGGSEAVHTRKVIRSLSNEEQSEVVKLLDGQKPIAEASSFKVKEAYQTLRESTERLADMAIAAGVKMRTSEGKIIPFQKFKGEYFPHQYPEALFKDVEALRTKLLKAGNSPAAVEKMMKRVIEEGERFSSPQHARDFDMPSYREDLSVLENHQYDLARAIVRARKFGPGDVSDASSAISKLIKESDNPTEATKIVNDYLERLDIGDKTAQHKVYNAIVQAEVATKLSQFALTNMGDFANLASNLGVRNTAKAIAKTIASPHKMADFSTSVGSLAVLRKNLNNEVTAGNLLGKAYGITTTEKFIRTVGSIAGKSEAERIFMQAKKNPQLADKLQRFVEGDVANVLKQDKLTPEQLSFAASRGVELSSGIPDKQTLSKAFFADNPMMRLPLLFKRFAFANTKNMVDAVKVEPTRARQLAKAAKIIAAYQVAGELVGDTKAAIKGLVDGDVEESIKERGEYVGTGNKAFDRIMANFLQSALFGIVGDVSESVVKKRVGKGTGTALGPVGSDIDEALAIATDDSEGAIRGLGKAATRRIPIVGQGLSEKFFPTQSSSKKTFGFTPTRPGSFGFNPSEKR